MKESVFFKFKASFPEFGFEGINNAEYLANQLSSTLTKSDVSIINQGLWKDCGWAMDCEFNDEKISLFFAKYFDDEEWQFTLEPVNFPNIISRIFGKKIKPYKSSLKFISTQIFEVLNNSEHVSKLKVCLASNTKLEVNHIEKLKW